MNTMLGIIEKTRTRDSINVRSLIMLATDYIYSTISIGFNVGLEEQPQNSSIIETTFPVVRLNI